MAFTAVSKEFFDKISTLSTEELRAVNKALVGELRHRVAKAAISATARFKRGDKVYFDGGRRGIIVIEIDGTNRAGTSFKGRQLNGHGAQMKWTVSANLVKELAGSPYAKLVK